MFLIILFLGIYGLWVGELVILFWFIGQLLRLRDGVTDFHVSKKIPIFYMGYSLLVAFLIINNKYYFMTDSVIPIATRQANAVFVLAVTNVTTPLFWILESLKRRKIMKIASVNPVDPSVIQQEKR